MAERACHGHAHRRRRRLSGVEETYYRIDGGDETTYTAPFEISGEGTTTVEYWSVDVVGNVEDGH